MLEIRELKTKGDMKKFVDFPYGLFKNNPNWVPPLRSDELNTLDKNKNASFEHAQARFWMAYKDKKAVGRVGAIFLEKYEEKWGQKRLRFGWLDFIDDKEVAFALLDTVYQWASELNAAAVHGPLGFTDLDKEGMLIEGFDRQGSLLTIYNEPYYNQYLEEYGFEKDVDWVEYTFPVPEKNPVLYEKIAKRVTDRTVYRLKTFKTTKELLPWADSIFKIYNDCYDHLYGAMPLSKGQIAAAIDQYIKIVDPEFVLGIVDDKDRLVGFGIGLINLDDASKKAGGKLTPLGLYYLLKAMKARDTYVTMLLIGVAPEIQRNGAVALMLNQIVDVCHRRGINRVYCMPELEANQDVQKLWKPFDVDIVRRRRVYIKYLPGQEHVAYDYKAEQKKNHEQIRIAAAAERSL